MKGKIPKGSTQAWGLGLGFGLAGAAALLLRYGFRNRPRSVLPESLSPAIFSTKVVSTSRGQMVYHTSGAGDPIVFLHGIYPGASSYEWSRVYPEFTAAKEVIAPDLIGFGESQRPAKSPDLAEQSQALVEFLHLVCGDRPITIVASGISSKIVLLLSAQHPELLKCSILWMPLGVRQDLRGREARSAIGVGRPFGLPSSLWWRSIVTPAFFQSWIANIGFEEPTAGDEEAVTVLANCAALYRADSAIRAFLKGGMATDLSNRLKDISCPVFILWPEESDLHPVSEAEVLAMELPSAQLELIPKKGVLASLRSPAFFRATIESAISGMEGGLRVA